MRRNFEAVLRRGKRQFARPAILVGFLTLLVPTVFQAQVLSPKVGPGVHAALESEGAARVVIALQIPAAAAQGRDLGALRSEVAAAQASVLFALAPHEFRLNLQYEAIPALAGELAPSGLDRLVAHPLVRKVDLDVGGAGSLSTSVPLIEADDMHAQGITGDGVVVAVLDTGLDTDHADLADDLIHQECFLDEDGSIDGVGDCPNGSDRQSGAGAAEDGAGHGTHTTGVVTSKGTVAPLGVAPDAQIVAIKVLDDTGFAGTFAFFSEIVAALDFIINNRPDVQVINMSLGTFALFVGNCDNSTAFNMAGAAAINTLRASGVTAFASSDNDGSGTSMSSPACLSNVVSVGATNDSDVVAAFTNSNSTTDIMAPGVSITSAGLAGGTSTASGTSFASPHGAGCAALLIEQGTFVTPSQIEARLELSPVQVTDATNGLTFPRIVCSPSTPVLTPTPTATPTPTPTPEPGLLLQLVSGLLGLVVLDKRRRRVKGDA